MRLRPYIEDKDYEYIEKWIDNEKLMPYGVQILCHFP